MFFFRRKGHGLIVRKNKICSTDFRFWTYNKKIKRMVVVQKKVPDMWFFYIKIGNRTDSIAVSQLEYDNHNVGDIIPITYKKGLFYNDIYSID